MLTRRGILGPLAAAVVGLLAVLALVLATGGPLVSAAPPHIIWLSPQAFQAGQNIAGGHLSFSSPSGDEQHVTTDTVGDLQWVDYPLQLSNQLKVTQVITCYKLDSPRSFISQVRLSRSKIPPTATVVYDDGTDLTSVAGACRNGKVVPGISVSGEITLSLRLNYAATSSAINIGAIGLVVTP